MRERFTLKPQASRWPPRTRAPKRRVSSTVGACSICTVTSTAWLTPMRSRAKRWRTIWPCSAPPSPCRRACRAITLRHPAHSVRVGVGLHPWWITDGRCGEIEIEQAAQLAAASRFIGEVGLDFGPRHAANAQRQLDYLEAIARACAGHPSRAACCPSTPSGQRARRSTSSNAADSPRAHYIFHWFSGTSDQLARALDAGCLFSISERMLSNQERARIRTANPWIGSCWKPTCPNSWTSLLSRPNRSLPHARTA
ncbi:MAG: TatD family hydrolase [Collinsella aerofaciens]